MVRKHVANFLLASSLALGLTPLALAQPMEERGMERGRHAMQLRTLGLSEAQQDQVFKIFHDSRPAVYEQIKQLGRARLELGKLVGAERFDSARARRGAGATRQTRLASPVAATRPPGRRGTNPPHRARGHRTVGEGALCEAFA